MRVAFVSAAADPGAGSDRDGRLRRVAERLAGRGHDVAVLCEQWWDGDPETFEYDGVSYRAVTDEERNWFGLRLPAAVKRFDPDVVHAVHEPPEHVVAARVGGLLSSAPLVVDWYDPPAEAAPVTGDQQVAARVPAAIVAPSETVKTGIRTVGARADRIRVVPNGVEMDLVRSVAPAGDDDIVYSRRLDGDANLESLLLALAEYRERDWTATVIGDGPERAGYERQARDLRIDDRVEFVGSLPVEGRIARFKAAHVFVHTAYRTSFATDLLRALACGCVGIVEYHVASSAHELVERRERGFRATDDEEIVEALGKAGRLPRLDVDEEYASFDENAVLERYLDCYREVQADHGWL